MIQVASYTNFSESDDCTISSGISTLWACQVLAIVQLYSKVMCSISIHRYSIYVRMYIHIISFVIYRILTPPWYVGDTVIALLRNNLNWLLGD